MSASPYARSAVSGQSTGTGCMGMSAVYGVPDKTEAVPRSTERSSGAGHAVHTADMYGNGGNAIRGSRAGDPSRSGGAGEQGRDPDGAPLGLPRGVNGRPDYIRRSIEGPCGAGAPITSISTTCTASILGCRSRTASARWPSWCPPGRSASSESARSAAPSCGARTHAPIAAVQSEGPCSAATSRPSCCRRPGSRRDDRRYSPLGRGMRPAAPRHHETLTGDYRRFLPRGGGEPGREPRRRCSGPAGGQRAGSQRPRLRLLVGAAGRDVVPIRAPSGVKNLAESRCLTCDSRRWRPPGWRGVARGEIGIGLVRSPGTPR